MRIVLDLQRAQFESALKTVNNPTLLLAQAIVLNRGEHEIILALSGYHPNTIEPIRAAFNHLLPQKNIRVWHAPALADESGLANGWRRHVAERIREAFLACLQPDIVFIPGFIYGYEDKCITSIGVFAPNLKTVVAVDNIDAAIIRATDPIRLHLFELLKRADVLWVMPPLTTEQIIQHLEIPVERVRTALMSGDTEKDQQDVSSQAKNLLKIFEELTSTPPQHTRLSLNWRPKLAYVSPLPPERSGIADYSAELLPALACFYDIDVIVSQAEMSSSWVIANCGIQTSQWFLQNSHIYDRVLYHFGNSSYHQHMFELLSQVPGVVVLHDFYLGDAYYFLETYATSPHALTRALYKSHGYDAVAERFRVSQIADVVWKYPANLEVLHQAKRIIVHSRYSQCLANEWYGRQFSSAWAVIPLVRKPTSETNRIQLRQKLGINPGDFLICSFGILGATKLNHRLLEAWLNSRLATDANCFLVFVGKEQSDEYCVQLMQMIKMRGLAKHIQITGWVDMETFKSYLAAADIAVQLRSLSRGETSAAALDCMNYGLPTIVNANGSFAELPSDAVWMLPDAFENCQLTVAIETLWQDGKRRSALGSRAQEIVRSHHAPSICAEQYTLAIEQGYAWSQADYHGLIKAIAHLKGHQPTNTECLAIAQSISYTLPPAKAASQLLIDVSATCRDDLKTGIQRVVRALVWELLQAPTSAYRVEPVYLTDEGGIWHYRYARDWISCVLGFHGGGLADEPVQYSTGDVLLIADFIAGFAVEAARTGVFEELKIHGVGLHFFVYDLLPIEMPEFFPKGQFGFLEWLNALASVADGAICISQAVAEHLKSWSNISGPPRLRTMRIDWFHLGADIENSIPTSGFSKNTEKALSRINAAPSFLMVGTIEPRKGYLQTLKAFTQLWQEGVDINLVIVGKEGWAGMPGNMRRTIPEIVSMLRNHPKLGKRLLWLEGISDEYLERVYAASTCLIAASEGEGFGLPLIEAAKHKLPIIARDIPVFREVAGIHAYYFSGIDPEQLARAITTWLELKKLNRIPVSSDMPWLSWKQSVASLIKILLRV